MIPKGLFTQILLYIVSGVILMTYVHPTFEEVGEIQDQIQVLHTERDKVVSVNSDLAQLVSEMNSIPSSDRARIFTYLPDRIDELEVARDVYLMTENTEAAYKNISYVGSTPNSSQRSRQASDSLLTPHYFELSIESEYEGIKELLALFEQNHYPLEVREMEILTQELQRDETDTRVTSERLSALVTLQTYSIGESFSNVSN